MIKITIAEILGWADAYHATHGRWPTQRSGMILPGVNWATINQALFGGHRGLPGGSSLAALLAKRRGVRIARSSWRLKVDQILAWADDYRAIVGRWPTKRSGAIGQLPALTWQIVDQALCLGRHGMSAGMSLARLLAAQRGTTGVRASRRLTRPQILAWADAYCARHGLWPTRRSGPVLEDSRLTWGLIDQTLRHGRHGLAAGSSLAQLLQSDRGVRWRKSRRPPFDVATILAWADAHHLRHGQWPTVESGPVDGIPGEDWNCVSMALMFGLRGLPGGSSLIELLTEQRDHGHTGGGPKAAKTGDPRRS